MKLSSRLALQSSFYVFFGTLGLLLLVNFQLKNYAIEIAKEKVALLLAERQATISYVVRDLRPPLLELIKEQKIPHSYFEPSWMSAGYINRIIMNYINDLGFSDYYYKNAAIDARSPHNEADDIEMEYLRRAKQNPSIDHISSVEEINGKQFLVSMRPNAGVYIDVCMKCHSVPENAPRGLIEKYGRDRSFNKKVGDIPSILSVRIPLDRVYAKIDSLTKSIFLTICGFVILVFIVHWFVINRLIALPLNELTRKAVAIAKDDSLLGQTIMSSGKGELKNLSEAFSDMSKQLADSKRELEYLVEERTRELQSTKEELQNVFDKMLEGFAIHEMIFDDNNKPKDYRFLKVNPAFTDMIGLPAEEIVGRRVSEVVPGMENFWIERYGDVVQTGLPIKLHSYVKPLNKHFEVNAFKNDVNQFTCICNDVTSRILAEREMQELEEKLRHSQKMEAIGTLSGGIAHDFNNLLGVILGSAEMVQEDCPARSAMRGDIDRIIEASQRAKELVKQILAFSRQTETEQKPLQPALIIKEAVKMFRSSLPKTIDIQLNIDSEVGLIYADPTQIHQIMINLCTNAFHAMEETGGTLTITLKEKELVPADLIHQPHAQPGLFVEISVGDTGHGISPQVINKIFDPFFTTKEVGKGTGMGLAIIHGIVGKSGGFVSCKSITGEGTIFNVYLPVHEFTAEPETETTPSELTQAGIERILFIDDEEMLAEMGKTMLERLGYRVTVETSSIQALKIIQDQPDRFDLVVTDQTMPGMTGSDLARRILHIRPELPIILCTGFSNQISEEKAKIYGIKGFAMKPLAKKDLASLIRKVLEGE